MYFTWHVHALLVGDPGIGHCLPFPTDTFQMFDESKDGPVLAKLSNDSVPDTIDERVLDTPGKKVEHLNAFDMKRRQQHCDLFSSNCIGCVVVEIGGRTRRETSPWRQKAFSM